MGTRDYYRLYLDLGIKVASETSGEVSAFCLIHNDLEKPSFSFNRETGLYKCFVATCNAFTGGNYEKFYRLVKGENVEDEVPFEEIQKHHQALLKSAVTLKWLREQRGITEETAKEFLLGIEGDRLWIPIKSKGKYVNVRRHSTNKKAKVKTMSYKAGFGSVKFWPDIPEGTKNIILCEGELDCILLRQMGYQAFTTTGGAGSWKDEFTDLLVDVEDVAIIYDIDLAGRAGATLVAKKLQAAGIKSVKDILLPITSPSNGDITDYIVVYGAGNKEIDGLLKNAKTFKEEKLDGKSKNEIELARPQAISEVSRPENLGRHVSFRAAINGIDTNPYVVPKIIEFRCSVAGTKKTCILCTVFHAGGKLVVDVPSNSQDILRSVDVTEEQQKTFYSKAAGVYRACPAWTYNLVESYTLYDVRLVPEITYSSNLEQEYIVRQAFVIGHNIKANHVYELEGTPYSNPKNQYLTILMDKAVPARDNISEFKLTEKQREDLKIFQANGKSVKEKMYEIANDLSINITQIYSRESLIIACDLAYHSILNFNFQGRPLQKGRVDLLVIGDTRCGKTETFLGLLNHYRCGEIITGENTTKAGLLGGAAQTGDRWMTTWGKLPMNDRRLLIIDEISGMSVEDIGTLSGVRSSGIAEITKIQSEKMWARTRAIWSGNPRSTKSLSAFDTGVQAIKELIGRPEDIARFDIAIALMSGEVSLDTINAMERPTVPHKYDSELCNTLVMWAWSRRVDQVVFEKEAEELCLNLATKMSQRYSSAIPLVEGAEQRIKLARLAASCAARLYSTLDGEIVLVRPEHVRFVHSFLEDLYSGPGLNYLAFSKIKIEEQNLKDENDVRGLLTTFGPTFIDGLLDHQYIRMNDLEDILNLEKKEVKPIVSQLLKQKALKHYGNLYVKTPAFILLLRKMQVEKISEPKKVEVDF